MQQLDHGRHGFFGSLESLRGLAALSVALYHARWVSPLYAAGYVRNSYLMVDFFFVLSGFVICHAYGERITNRTELRDFLLLRLGRLYPLHVALLGIWLVLEVVKYIAELKFGLSVRAPAFSQNSIFALVLNLLLAQSFDLHKGLAFNVPSWSIGTEFYTYAAFALVVLAVRRKRWWLPVFAIVSATSCAVLLLLDQTDLNTTYDFGYFRCALGFFLGAASYLVFARSGFFRSVATRAVAPYVATASLVGAGLYLGFKSEGPSDFLFPLFSAILITSLAASRGSTLDRWLQIPALTWLGKVSYSVYMVHFLLAWTFSYILRAGLRFELVLTQAGDEPVGTDPIAGTIALLSYIGAVLILSHLTFRWIEDRFRQKTKVLVANLDAQDLRLSEKISPRSRTPRALRSPGPASFEATVSELNETADAIDAAPSLRSRTRSLAPSRPSIKR